MNSSKKFQTHSKNLRDDANNSLLDALEHFVVVILPKQGNPYSNKSVLT